MKKAGLFFMIVGILLPLNSTLFTVANMPDNAVLILLFWGLLLLLQILFACVLLFSKSQLNLYPQKITFAIVTVLTLVWFAIVFFGTDRKSIFIWALNTLSFSVPYFAGLLVYKREKEM